MTIKTAPSLDDLLNTDTPAWLWDGARMRIVWANPAGIGLFGCDSLFDLIDTPFDETDPGVGRVHELAKTVKRDESWQEMISFASAINEDPFSVTVHVHALADGRNGLLMVTEERADPVAGTGSDNGLAHSVLETLPVATLICDALGSIEYANIAARQIFGDNKPAFSESGEAIAKLLDRATRAGVAAATMPVETGFGTRQVRCTAKPLTQSGGFSIVVEDVTDRRALERGFTGAASGSSGKAAAAETSQAVRKQAAAPETLTSLRQAIEAASEHKTDSGPGNAEKPGTPSKPSIQPLAAAKQAEHAKPAGKRFEVAEIVRSALSRIPRAIVLFRAGKIIYANQAVADALGYDNENLLVGRHDIAAVLATITARSGQIFLTANDGADVEFIAEKSTFPWNDGAMPMAILSLPGQKTGDLINRSRTAKLAKDAVQPASDTTPATRTTDQSSKGTAGLSEAPAAQEPQPDVALVATTRKPATDKGSELLSILDTASDGIVFLSTDGNITHVSAGAEALFGVHAAGVIDTPLAGLMDQAGAKVVRDYVSALGDSGLSMVFNRGREVIARMTDGGEVPLFITMRKISQQIPDIPDSAFCAVLRDITQWKKTEAELRSARDKAEYTSRQKSDFLARISHELRTPLNAILGFSDVMRKGQFGKLGSERYEGYANDIHTSGEYLLSLVNDLLDLSKVEAGKLELNFISVDLGQAIDACIKLMQDEATGARIVLRKSVPENLPQVVADMRSIKQVLLNLVGNSIKFTDPGGQIIISAKAMTNGELMLSVTDTGVGMDEGQLSRALEPFQRIDIAGRADVQGTGLGLPLTKALVEANRAEFAITSEARKGTRVDITFPTTRVLAS